MVYVLIAYSAAYNLVQILSDYGNFLPEEYIDKAERYTFERDACHFLLGKILLLKGVRKMGYFDIALHNLRLNEFSKPYFDNDLSFNISHSGNYVICALSKTCKVGVDLEEVKAIEINDFSNCFSTREQKSLLQATDPIALFYKLWTRKEAVIKADGKGLHIPLSCFEVIENNVSINSCNWFINELSIAEGYIAHIATNRPCEIALLNLM